MRVLLDECVDRNFASELVGHSVSTVPQMGWAGKRNGELLALASQQFDAFVTVDQGLPHQQQLADLSIAVVVLVARSNRLVDLRELIPELLELLPTMTPGEVARISWK
jgi:hypothetical protein